MKRQAILLFLQPYKNRLLPRGTLKEVIDRFAEQLLALAAEHPNFHFNVILPGYILECINPFLISKLRELHKRGCLEWLLTGYTEPFLSFFPVKITEENIRHGVTVFSELTGSTPSGFAPPFSNWEPSYIPTLSAIGLQSTILSCTALPLEARGYCSYWITEFGGEALALFPTHILHHFSAPADIIDWLEKLISRDDKNPKTERCIGIQYLIPLYPESGIDPYRWLRYAVAELDKRILLYESLLLQEARSLQSPIGLQHLPQCLPLLDAPGEREPHYFLNRFHSYDQVGIIQRKVLELCERAAHLKDGRLAAQVKQSLYFLEDINRYLPVKNRGFTSLSHRQWSYNRLIGIERMLREHEGASGGRIRIIDFLRSGDKSIIMSNSGLKVYINHKNGGHIFELDYRDRAINLCAAFNPAMYALPAVLSPGTSYSAFIDRIGDELTTDADITAGALRDVGNFAEGPFEYKIKKTTSGVKTALSRQGSFLLKGKSYPLRLEKVFGLEKDDPALSFVYQLTNHSLASLVFTLAIDLNLSLHGALEHACQLVTDGPVVANLGWEANVSKKITKWCIDDLSAGVRLQFVTQKPLDLFCLPLSGSDGSVDPSCGVRLVLVSRIELESSSSWTLMGNVVCKKIREKQKVPDDAL